MGAADAKWRQADTPIDHHRTAVGALELQAHKERRIVDRVARWVRERQVPIAWAQTDTHHTVKHARRQWHRQHRPGPQSRPFRARASIPRDASHKHANQLRRRAKVVVEDDDAQKRQLGLRDGQLE